jgi:hypothetical protein
MNFMGEYGRLQNENPLRSLADASRRTSPEAVAFFSNTREGLWMHAIICGLGELKAREELRKRLGCSKKAMARLEKLHRRYRLARRWVDEMMHNWAYVEPLTRDDIDAFDTGKNKPRMFR